MRGEEERGVERGEGERGVERVREKEAEGVGGRGLGRRVRKERGEGKRVDRKKGQTLRGERKRGGRGEKAGRERTRKNRGREGK